MGPSRDQWRPCSEKYFPYLPSPRPIIRSQKDNRKNQDNARHLDDNTNQDTNFSSRRWPVAYLHCEPPPSGKDPVLQKNLPLKNGTRTRKRVEKSTDPPRKRLKSTLLSLETNVPVKSQNESFIFSENEQSTFSVTGLRNGKVEKIPNPVANQRRNKSVTPENWTNHNDTRIS